jgi:MAF protein
VLEFWPNGSLASVVDWVETSLRGLVKPQVIMREAPILYLASASPRRRRLLEMTGWPAIVRPVQMDETPLDGESASSLAKRLATEKARLASAEATEDAWVFAADTVVFDGDNILGKPEDREQAKRMLQSLRGREHQVVTALAIRFPEKGRIQVEVCETMVPMRDMTDAEIEAYIEQGSPMDKAGGYGIQDDEFQFVEVDRLRGCFTNVMGLPLCLVIDALASTGLRPPQDVTAACTRQGSVHCAVPAILWEESA